MCWRQLGWAQVGLSSAMLPAGVKLPTCPGLREGRFPASGSWLFPKTSESLAPSQDPESFSIYKKVPSTRGWI